MHAYERYKINAVSTEPAPVLNLEYRCKSDMGIPAIWDPRDMGTPDPKSLAK